MFAVCQVFLPHAHLVPRRDLTRCTVCRCPPTLHSVPCGTVRWAGISALCLLARYQRHAFVYQTICPGCRKRAPPRHNSNCLASELRQQFTKINMFISVVSDTNIDTFRYNEYAHICYI